MTTTLSAKGQIVIPRDVRDLLGLKTGDDLIVLCSSDADILLRPIRKQKKQGLVNAFQKMKGFQFERLVEPARNIQL